VANKQEYLARLQMAIEHLHKCRAEWRETVPVHEMFQGQTVWQGDVEVFDLTGHPKAKRCYGWSHREGPNDEGGKVRCRLGNTPGGFGGYGCSGANR
jgi:hypothetical protein